jgi:hypothetical protein
VPALLLVAVVLGLLLSAERRRTPATVH